VSDVSDVPDVPVAGVPVAMKELLAEVIGDPALAGRISDDADVVDELRLDSLQMISFLLAIEDRFDVELDFESLQLDDLRSLRRFCALVLPGVSGVSGVPESR
jgi:acyl carrier protein